MRAVTIEGNSATPSAFHSHVFLGEGHEKSERKTWAVIWLCEAMMIAEIVGGLLFGSIALVADGLHMSTHAGALLLAALAYTYARKHARDPHFTFGAGKLGDLAGFSSAIILVTIALLIGCESVSRLFAPVAITAQAASVETVRPNGARQRFAMKDQGGYLVSTEEIPEPHAFTAHVRIGRQDYPVLFEEHEHAHGSVDRDNNMRAAVIHVMADAAVSVLVIVGLSLARAFGWLWMDPLVGIVGATVIASWSYGLIRDTSAIPLDTNPDQHMASNLRQAVESEGDQLADLHISGASAGAFGSHHFCHNYASAGRGLLSRPARALQVAVASDRRGFA
jgi:cation diffusion facilitator family transporter